MESWFHYILLICGGVIAGVISVLSGSGSLIMLPMLMGTGLTTHLANGTNRVMIFMQDISATMRYMKRARPYFRLIILIAIPTLIGTISGAFFATNIGEELLNIIILIVLVGMFLYFYFRREKKKTDNLANASDIQKQKIDWLTWVIFLILGVYAGFIQASCGVMWIAAIAWRFKLDFVTANIMRVVLSLFVTLVSLIIFLWHGQIAILDGILIGIGGFIGGAIGSKIILKVTSSFIRKLMLVVISLSILYILSFKILHLF